MGYQSMNIRLNKGKSIGKVLYIVEGGRTEPYLLHRIFCSILDYQMETILRNKKYRKYNSKENANSQVFVINAEESNIKYIARDNEFLNKLFVELIENYDFDVDNAAIFYMFDRDNKSNTDSGFIRDMLSVLNNSRDNEYDRQGLLLLSYPSVEAFTLSNFTDDTYKQGFQTGNLLKKHLQDCGINHNRISEDTLINATKELLSSLNKIEIDKLDVDDFCASNMKIFEHEELEYERNQVYRALSLLAISLIDLGVVEIDE